METNRVARRILILGAIVLVLLALGLAAVFQRTSRVNITTNAAVSTYFAAVTPYKTNTFLVTDSSKIVSYNYTTGTSTPISTSTGDRTLADIDTLSVSSDKRYVMFHIPTVSSDSGLSTILQQHGYDTSSDYWWVFDTTAQTYQPLPAGTLLAQFSGNKVYTLATDATGEAILSYAPDTLNQLSKLSIVPSTDFAVTAQGILLQNTDGNIYLTKDGVVNRQLITKAALITANNNQLIVTQTQGDNLALLTVDLVTDSTKILADNVTDQPRYASNMLLYNTSKDSGAAYYLYDLATKKTTAWNMTNKAFPGGNTIALLDSHTALMTNNGGRYYLVGTMVKGPN